MDTDLMVTRQWVRQRELINLDDLVGDRLCALKHAIYACQGFVDEEQRMRALKQLSTVATTLRRAFVDSTYALDEADFLKEFSDDLRLECGLGVEY